MFFKARFLSANVLKGRHKYKDRVSKRSVTYRVRRLVLVNTGTVVGWSESGMALVWAFREKPNVQRKAPIK